MGRSCRLRTFPAFLLAIAIVAAFTARAISRAGKDYALIQAVHKGDAAAVNRLLDAGASPNADATDLDYAHESVWQRLKVVLHPAGGADHTSALGAAVSNGSEPIVKALLERGASGNAVCFGGESAIEEAVGRSAFGIMHMLLGHGADVNSRDRTGSTLLVRAALDQNEDEARLLFDHGCDVNAVNHDGATALMIACYRTEPGLVRALIAHGADVSARDRAGRSVACYAAEPGSATDGVACMSAVLSAGADPNVKDASGLTPLLRAELFRARSALTLLAHGADPNCHGTAGQQPAIAVNTQAINEFTSGVSVTATGETPLMLAASVDNVPLIQLLLRKGADPRARDAHGSSALKYTRSAATYAILQQAGCPK